MLPLLTKYLIQYKRVCIPHVGTFELVQQPPQLLVADQLFMPPFFTTTYIRKDELPEHQSHFFSAALQAEQDDLFAFGARLRHRLRKEPLQWNGFGILRHAGDEVVFEPQDMHVPALQPVPAQKIVRQHASHSVRVGDHQMMRQASETRQKPARHRSWWLIAGWVLLLLALLAIMLILYAGHFEPAAAGLTTSAG